MIPAHEQRLRAERDAAVAEAAEWKRQRDDMSDKLDAALRDALATAQELRQGIEEKEAAVKAYVGPAIDALHAAGILTFGTLAQGVEKLAGERDEARAALSGKTCAKCEETERALRELSRNLRNRLQYEDPLNTAYILHTDVRLLGLWRDPAPARADESGGGVAS